MKAPPRAAYASRTSCEYEWKSMSLGTPGYSTVPYRVAQSGTPGYSTRTSCEYEWKSMSFAKWRSACAERVPAQTWRWGEPDPSVPAESCCYFWPRLLFRAPCCYLWHRAAIYGTVLLFMAPCCYLWHLQRAHRLRLDLGEGRLAAVPKRVRRTREYSAESPRSRGYS